MVIEHTDGKITRQFTLFTDEAPKFYLEYGLINEVDGSYSCEDSMTLGSLEAGIEALNNWANS